MASGRELEALCQASSRAGAFVEEHRGTLIDLCGRMVAARSVNPPGRTTDAAAVLQKFLSTHGVSSQMLANIPDTPNVVSQCQGHAGGSHLVLNGHLDTIGPGEEGEWTVPIHEMTKRDGRLYGIGMGNMKAGVSALSLAYAFLARHTDLWRGTVSLTAVADETIFGPNGAAWLLDTKPELRGDALICGEGPGSMELSIAEKGVLWITLEARAAAGQGMLSRRGSSAITRLCNALAELDAWNDEMVAAPTELSCLDAHAGEHGLRISVNAGTINGGKFFSQVATRAVAEIDIRVPPGLTSSDIERQLRKIVEGVPYLDFRRIKGWEPNWTAPQSHIVTSVSDAAKLVRGNAPKPVVRLPASDASRWRSRGVPAVCYGPQPMLASGVDDFAYEQDIIDCAKIYATAALSYLAGP